MFRIEERGKVRQEMFHHLEKNTAAEAGKKSIKKHKNFYSFDLFKNMKIISTLKCKIERWRLWCGNNFPAHPILSWSTYIA